MNLLKIVRFILPYKQIEVSSLDWAVYIAKNNRFRYVYATVLESKISDKWRRHPEVDNLFVIGGKK